MEKEITIRSNFEVINSPDVETEPKKLTKQQQRRKENPKKGLCIECNEPLDPSSTCKCSKHFHQDREYRQRPEIKQRKRELKQKLRQKRKETGLCVRCGVEPLLSKTLCYNCLLDKKAIDCFGTKDKSYLLIAKIEAQTDDGGIFHCALCEDEITIGENAQIGHFKSSSREGKTRKEARKETKIEEIHWICGLTRRVKKAYTCNSLQNQFSLEEFETIVCPGMCRKNINKSDLHLDKVSQQYIKICINRNLISPEEKEVAITKLRKIGI